MTTEVYTTEKNLKKFHHEILIWKSTLKFIKVEVDSMSQLLNSFEYEPSTANLFEKLIDYRQEVTRMKEDTKNLFENISKHENNLSDLLVFDFIPDDHLCNEEQQLLGYAINNLLKKYRELKSEVFNYSLAVLRKNKQKQ